MGIDVLLDAVDRDAGTDPDRAAIGEAAGHRDDRGAIVRGNIKTRPGQGRVGQICGRVAVDRVVGHGTGDARAAGRPSQSGGNRNNVGRASGRDRHGAHAGQRGVLDEGMRAVGDEVHRHGAGQADVFCRVFRVCGDRGTAGDRNDQRRVFRRHRDAPRLRQRDAPDDGFARVVNSVDGYAPRHRLPCLLIATRNLWGIVIPTLV